MAFVAHNDLLARGLLPRSAERGVAVPDRMGVAGYGDIFGADLGVPALTTLSGPEDEAGRTVGELLSWKGSLSTTHPAPQRVGLPVHLVIRDSTGPAPDR